MAGIYVHIPFCKSRCKYCDFFSTTQLDKQVAYMNAVLAEWESRQNELSERIETIYFGGGTPSTLPNEALHMLVDCLQAKGQAEEITLEANPGDITQEKVRAWKAMGINRLSIGVQSFDDGLLQRIGRRHTAAQAKEAIQMAQAAGFDNISIDLMYALPSQTLAQWKKDIAVAVEMNVQHISSYGLIYEEGTVLTNMLSRGEIEMVDEELEMQMYDCLVEALLANGYVHYEVSNFARAGYESRHNSSYWRDVPYIGLGAGAHSYDGKKRMWNISDVDGYIQQAMAQDWQAEMEILGAEERRTERIMLGLRTKQGIHKEWVKEEDYRHYVEQGMLKEKEGYLVATTQGYHILNRIIEDLL